MLKSMLQLLLIFTFIPYLLALKIKYIPSIWKFDSIKKLKLFDGKEQGNTNDSPMPNSYSGISLVELLASAQEAGLKNTSKLKSLVAKSFVDRYELAKEQLKPLTTALTYIDYIDEDDIEAINLSRIIQNQLSSIEKIPSSIIFYNEPLPKLEELSFPWKYDYIFFKSILKLQKDNSQLIVEASIDDDDINRIEKSNNSLRQQVKKSFQSLLSAVTKADNNDPNVGINLTSNNSQELRKLKLGIKLENRRWRSEASKLLSSASGITDTISSQTLGRLPNYAKDSFSILGSSAKSRITGLNNQLKGVVDNYLIPAISPIRNLLTNKSSDNDQVANSDANPVSQRVLRHMSKSTYSRWRDSMSLIQQATFTSKNISKQVNISFESNTINSIKSSEEDIPNFALLLHSCLLMSMATYNLRLTPGGTLLTVPWGELGMSIGSLALLGSGMQGSREISEAFVMDGQVTRQIDRAIQKGFTKFRNMNISVSSAKRLRGIFKLPISRWGKNNHHSSGSSSSNSQSHLSQKDYNVSLAGALYRLNNDRARVMATTSLGIGYDSAIHRLPSSSSRPPPPPTVTRSEEEEEEENIKEKSVLSHSDTSESSSTSSSNSVDVTEAVTTTGVTVSTLSSMKACAVYVHDSTNKHVMISFRGTKDPIDVVTDITFFSSEFIPMLRNPPPSPTKSTTTTTTTTTTIPLSTIDLTTSSKSSPTPLSKAHLTDNPTNHIFNTSSSINANINMDQPTTEAVDEWKEFDTASENEREIRNMLEVHRGFQAAFESLKDCLDARIQALPEGTSVLLVGHSMGGALAQLAAAYYSHLTPWLVTFAAPAVGNGAFCQYLRQHVRPFGGIRVWNEFDAVPYLPLLVGYEHTGVPVKLKLKSSAKDLFQNESINAIAQAIQVIAPHILYQIGSLVHVFPVLGADDVGAKGDEGYPLSSSAVQLELEYTQAKWKMMEMAHSNDTTAVTSERNISNFDIKNRLVGITGSVVHALGDLVDKKVPLVIDDLKAVLQIQHPNNNNNNSSSSSSSSVMEDPIQSPFYGSPLIMSAVSLMGSFAIGSINALFSSDELTGYEKENEMVGKSFLKSMEEEMGKNNSNNSTEKNILMDNL